MARSCSWPIGHTILHRRKAQRNSLLSRVLQTGAARCRTRSITKAGHLAFEAVNRAGAKTCEPGRLGNSDTLGQLDACVLDLLGLGSRPAEALHITPALDVNLPSLAIAALMALSAARTRWWSSHPRIEAQRDEPIEVGIGRKIAIV
jgi:hypothetical protein